AMSNLKIRCAHCRCLFLPNPRVKNQCYCSKKACQAARKNRWLKQKLATDDDYRLMKKECQQDWARRHPAYWRQYRRRRRQYTDRNRQQQKFRRRGVLAVTKVVKKDALDAFYDVKPGRYFLVPFAGKNVAKKDALMVNISPITA
ncbi:MAG: hypothetical protein AB1461_21100, partial [Thermodesulfobacteriota bacterium]